MNLLLKEISEKINQKVGKEVKIGSKSFFTNLNYLKNNENIFYFTGFSKKEDSDAE
jgi:hypothetical protein